MTGMPLKVGKFVPSLDFSKNKDCYCYAVATCGGSDANALPQLGKILSENGIKLSYNDGLKMF